MDVLVKILRRYHIVLVQEIRDNTDTALDILMTNLNKGGKTQYKYVQSDRLGRTDSKERYAYIYDPSKVNVVAQYQFPETKNWYQRAPFSAVFSLKANPTKKFMFSGVHTQPTDAVKEIDHLVDVYDFYAAQADTKNVIKTNWIVMGDFNAGGSYVSNKSWEKIRLRTDTKFTWLIKDGTRTTVADNNNAYDRFVTTSGFAKSQADVFRFDEAFGLTPAFTKVVSDHFPIECTIDV